MPDTRTGGKSGGVFSVAHTLDVSTIDPTKSAAGGTITIPNATYNRLLQLKNWGATSSRAEVEPELADSWERSQDGLSFTFNIHPGIKFQTIDPLNGRDFSAEDVKFAYERYATEGVHQNYLVTADSFEAVDDHTLKINMKAPVADFIVGLGTRYLTIFPRELVDNGDIETTAVGTGPAILKEMEQGSRIALDTNPDYWRGKPYLDGLEFRVMPDVAARRAQFRVGNVDYALAFANTQADVEKVLETNPDTLVQTVTGDTSTFTIMFNLTLAKFQDERIRQAMMLALDRQLLVDLMYDGDGFVLPTIPWYYVTDERPAEGDAILGPWWRYAPDEAKKLLQAAGAENFEFDIVYYNYRDQWNTQQNEAIIPMFADVGITMNAFKVDYTEFNSQLIQRTFEETADGWPAPAQDASGYFFNQVRSDSGGNRWRIDDPDIDQWADDQQFELDPDARREIHRKIWDRILDRAYRVEKASGPSYYLYQPWAKGFQWSWQASDFYEWGAQLHHIWLDK
jgi:peptide/nickel transport system substrate-binding protein